MDKKDFFGPFFSKKIHFFLLFLNFLLIKYVRSRHALLKALTRPFLGFVINPKFKNQFIVTFLTIN